MLFLAGREGGADKWGISGRHTALLYLTLIYSGSIPLTDPGQSPVALLLSSVPVSVWRTSQHESSNKGKVAAIAVISLLFSASAVETSSPTPFCFLLMPSCARVCVKTNDERQSSQINIAFKPRAEWTDKRPSFHRPTCFWQDVVWKM